MNDGKFKPGNNANPTGSDGGKRRLNQQLAEKLMHCVPKAAKFVESSLNSSKYERQEWATELVFNRVYGKAPESLELSGPEGGPVSIMSDMPLTMEQFMAKFAPKADDESA